MTHFTSKLLASSAIEIQVRQRLCGVIHGQRRQAAGREFLARWAASPTIFAARWRLIYPPFFLRVFWHGS
jgi:hypothetical protein